MNKMRVRFAPAPTGMMHLGNVRAALMNFLFAKQKDGTFILRVEDTDPERNFDPGAKNIIEDLHWLGIRYDEGPEVGGPHAPYFQSERTNIYQEKLQKLIDQKKIYRCFCTTELLDKKRQRQIAMKKPPRYDRACLALSDDEIKKNLDAGTSFVWRVKLDHEQVIEITDLAHGTIRFELKNFSDFPITRQNSSFTFMFANFVDDMVMEMTHVMRGEDHLTNTAGQAALYHAFGKELPTFWHMPILCNINGKKLSKRDFGFSLRDLKAAGYLPEAICNYLAIIGGSFEQEIMSLDELAQQFPFDNIHTTGQIKYDVEKLRWVNKKWIARYDDGSLAKLCRPFIEAKNSQAKDVDDTTLARLIGLIKTDLVTLEDSALVLSFYFEAPDVSLQKIKNALSPEKAMAAQTIVAQHIDKISDVDAFVTAIKADAKAGPGIKSVFTFVRLALMSATSGPMIHDLVEMLGVEEAEKRIREVL